MASDPTPDTVVTWTQSGREALNRINEHIGSIAAATGEDSEQTNKAIKSMYWSLLQLQRLGGTVSGDGELGLWLQSQNLVVGVVFHREGEPIDLYHSQVQCGTWSTHS